MLYDPRRALALLRVGCSNPSAEFRADSLAIVKPVRPSAVLLVDDMVDSRWTLTLAAWLLRSNGSGPVWPLALARSGGGE